MIVDPNDRDWQISIALMIGSIVEVENVGLLLVPKSQHTSAPWLNNRVPGVTVAMQMVPTESLDDVTEACERMATILTGGEL